MTDVHDAEHLAALEARLAEMNGAWDSVPEDSGSIYTAPPDGEYPALLLEFKFIERKDPPHDYFLVMVWQIKALMAGKRVEQVYALEDPERLQILKSALSRLESLPERFSDIRPGTEYMNGLLDMPAIIAVRTAVDRETGEILHDDRGRRRINVYVNERVGNPEDVASIDWKAIGEQLNGGFKPNANGFAQTPQSDLGNAQEQFGEFGSTGTPSMYRQTAADDDIPF